MKRSEFDQLVETGNRQRQTSAWIAEALANNVRRQTGRTVADLNDGRNTILTELNPAMVSRLAEHERDAALMAKLAAE